MDDKEKNAEVAKAIKLPDLASYMQVVIKQFEICLLYTSIAAQKINRKATLVIALSFALGLSVEMVPEILCQFPESIKNIFSSGITTVELLPSFQMH